MFKHTLKILLLLTMSLTLIGCTPTTKVHYVYNKLEDFKFNVDPSKLPKVTPIVPIPTKEGDKSVPAPLSLQIAVSNNVACLKTEDDYTFLLNEYVALTVAVTAYVKRYNELADQNSAKETESTK